MPAKSTELWEVTETVQSIITWNIHYSVFSEFMWASSANVTNNWIVCG